VRPGRLELPAS